MQSDFHYFGTYALARLAGLNPGPARIVATASEYTDESVSANLGVHADGCMFVSEDTAHRLLDLKENSDPADQRRVWVPFHFLPGGEGETLTDKLVCRKDSVIAREMVRHALGLATKPFALELLGVTAHVYADTFAHYGFSGVSSRRNRVASGTIEVFNDSGFAGKLDSFFNTRGAQGGLFANFRNSISGAVAEETTGALGHGAVATCPDEPYLTWSYQYEFPALAGQGKVERMNMVTFLSGSAKLYQMFRDFLSSRPDCGSPGPDFATIEAGVRAVLMTRGDTEARGRAWSEALKSGVLCADVREAIPTYAGADWNADRDALTKLASSREATQKPVYRFFQAAALHRDYVLRDLLPSHGIVVR